MKVCCIYNKEVLMKKYFDILKKSKLFSGIEDSELESMLHCLQAREKHYDRAEYVVCAGDIVRSIFLVVSGSLLIQTDDYWGNRSILDRVAEGEMFGEIYAAPGCGTMQTDVVAACDCTVILLDVNRILTVCTNACRFHTMTVRNLFYSISEKNLRLIEKVGHMSKRTTREKLMSYLSDESKRQGTSEFIIPYNRQELADFLSVDRSAMSSELSRMRDEGMLEFERSRFVLL